MEEVLFLADCMLGTLAKWLRFLGYDTAYHTHWEDHETVRLARAEGRILLSRDVALLKRKGLQSLFITSEVLEEQLAQVMRAFGLRARYAFSRCPTCNALLENVGRDEAWGQVPSFVFATQDKFSLCPECNHFYWRGTHYQHMLEQLDKLRSQIEPCTGMATMI